MNNDSNEQYEYCPRCDANLTLQKGYSNDLPYWVCKGCGEMLINPEVDADDDIAWICDHCGAMLNVQSGFDKALDKWVCTKCGFENAIDEKNLYDTEESYIADLHNPYRGLSDEEVLYLSSYCEENSIADKANVLIVSDPDTGKRYIKKYLTVYDKSIYEYLKDHPVDHMPRIEYLAEGSNCLVVLEEYIEGSTVEALVGASSLTYEQSLRIARSVCEILKTIHNLPNPIVHRDIKPSNVIVTDSGDVLLRKFLEGCSFGQDSSYKDVVLLYVSFLPRGLRIAVEDAGAPYANLAKLQCMRPFKLYAIVSQDNRKDTTKGFCPELIS